MSGDRQMRFDMQYKCGQAKGCGGGELEADRSTSMVLLAGKGSGAFSVPAGATSVAKELDKLASRYRTEQRTN